MEPGPSHSIVGQIGAAETTIKRFDPILTMTKAERKQHIIDIHKRAIAALVDDENESIDMFIMRSDALDELLKGAMAMIEMMHLFDPPDDNDPINPYF